MSTFNKEVNTWIRQNKLIIPGDHVICAVSGGVDSIVLLHMLNSMKNNLKIKVSAAHFNHCIRGAESDRDEEFVRQFCKDNDIPFYCGKGDVPKRVAETHESVEEAARNLRYGFLESIDPKAKIATAHHANDNLETILMNMIRGSATGGLAGIPLTRGNIIRPLLCMTRQELEEYADENGIEHVEDSTNVSNDYLRNRVRHNIIPLLLAENPTMLKGMVRTASSVREDTGYLNNKADVVLNRAKVTEKEDTYNVAELRVAKPIQTRVMLKILDKYGIVFNNAHIEDLIKCVNSSKQDYKLSLPNDITAIRYRNELTFVRNYDREVECNPIELNTSGDTVVESLGVVVSSRIIENVESISKSHNRLLVSVNSLKGTLYIRTKCDGDKIKTSGGTKPIGKYLRSKNVPEYLRNKCLVIVDEKGLVCVPDFGIDMSRKVEIGDTALEILIREIGDSKDEKSQGIQ